MSNPNHPIDSQVDPSEGAIDEGDEQQGLESSDTEDEQSAPLEVDPSEGPKE